MPLDPDISLDVVPRGGQPQVGAGANPLAMVQGYVDTASKLQALRQFNLQLQARQRAAEILSTAPDMQSGIQAVLHDPVAAFGAGQTLSDYSNAYQALTGVQGQVQQQATSGLGNLVHMLNGSLEDPAASNSIIQSYLETVSPQARPQVKAAIDRLQGYLGPLPPDQRRRVLASTIMGSGVSPDVVRATTGAPPPSFVSGPFGPEGATTVRQVGGPAYGGAVQTAPAAEALQAAGATLAGGAPAGVGAPRAPAGVAPQGPTIPTQTFLKGRAADITQELSSLDERVQKGGTIMQTIAPARQALDQIRAGGGASAYSNLAQLAQAFGARENLVDKIANGDLAASQEFSKLMVNTTMSQIQTQMVSGSRLNRDEWEAFTKNNPNLDTDPQAIDKIFDFWTRIFNRDATEQRVFNEARRQPGFDILSWPTQWTQYQLQHGMIQTSTPLAGSQTAPQGIPAGAKQWKIEGGKLVPVQ